MLEGDLKDHDIRLYLGMPMYGGMLGENTMHGVLGLQAWTSDQGVGMKLQTMGNESLITRARNTIATMFLDDQNYVGTHLLISQYSNNNNFDSSKVNFCLSLFLSFSCKYLSNSSLIILFSAN